MNKFEHIGPIKLPLGWGDEVKECTLQYYGFQRGRYLVVEVGDVSNTEDILVRIQSACALAVLFESRWCDCAWQFEEAKRMLFKEGKGILIHAFDQHGKGLGLKDHYRVYAEGQKRNLELLTETFDFLGFSYENREYGELAELLQHYKLSSFRLLTNDPARLKFFEEKGFKITRVPLVPPSDEYNQREIAVKKEKFGHLY